MGKIQMFYCEYCNWKKILNKDETNENCKCLSCGRLLRIRQALDPQKKIEEDVKLKKILKEQEVWKKEMIEFKRKFKENKDE